MALSSSLRRALGDNSMYVRGMDGAKSSVQTQIENASTRLNAAGVSTEGQQSQNFLLKALDIIARPGYGATGLIREFTDPSSGGTPGEFDPLGAFWRGLKGEEKSTGKDVFMDAGLPGDEGIFGGEAKWYNPSPAGALGLALDIFNPLDPINWLGFGVGDDIVKGASKGLNALTDAFGATKAAQIADILTASAKVADTVGDVADATKIIDTIGDTAKAAKVVDTTADAAQAAKAATSILDDLGAETVGKLAAQITSKVDDVDSLRRINELIQEGLKETGKVATSKLDYAVSKPLSIGLQNPLSVTPIGRVKTPGYTARGGKGAIPIFAPGKDIAGTFIDIPGSENVTRIVGSIATKIKNTEVGQALGKMFSTVFVPNTVPASVVTRSMTAKNMDDLVKLSRTSPANVPLSVEELLTLQDDLAGIKLGKTFDYADDFSATELKLLNKGEYFSVEDLAKKVGLKEFTTDDVLTTLAQTPFNKTITELYDDLRLLKPTADAKELFTNAAKIRKMMDLMYEQIPEGAKPFFTGVLKSQLSDLYPSDITTARLGKNVASSPLMAYEFNYKGVPVSVVVNSGENFNVNAWAKLSSTFEALDELPETAIQALKGQIDVSPIPIKSPDTSMTIGDTIVLGRIDKPTVAHEFGHVWDAAAGDQNAYTQAILSDAQKFDNTITPDDLYSDYSRSIYASDTTTGLKEDFADSVSDYLRDRSSFRSQYPGRAAEIEKVLDQVSIPQEELAKMIAEQRKLAEQVSNIPRAEAQIKAMLDSVDKYAYKFTSEAGGKTYQTFRKNLAALYEQTNWKTKQWQEQVEALFQGIDAKARKQIMDAAAQITGTEIPGRAKSMAQPMFAEQVNSKIEDLFPKRTKGVTPVYHVTTPEIAEEIMKRGYFIPSDIATEAGAMSNNATFFAPDPYSSYRWTEQIGIESDYVMIRGEIPAGLTTLNYDDSFKDLVKRAEALGLSEEQLKPIKTRANWEEFSEDYVSDATALTGWAQSVGFTNKEQELLGDVLYGMSHEKEVMLFDPKGVTNLKAVSGTEIDNLISDAPLVPNPNYDPNKPFSLDGSNPRYIKDPSDTKQRGPAEVRKQLFGVQKEKPLFSQQDYPVFASKLQSVVDDMPNKMSVDQFKAYLKNKRVRVEELKWTFMDDFLEGKTSITKAEAQDWVRGNQLEVREVWRTDSSPQASKIRAAIEENGTTWEQVQQGIEEMRAGGDSDQTIIAQLQEAFEVSYQDAQAMLQGNIDQLAQETVRERLAQTVNIDQLAQETGIPTERLNGALDEWIGRHGDEEGLAVAEFLDEIDQDFLNQRVIPRFEEALEWSGLELGEYGEILEPASSGLASTKYSQYTQPGGQDYMELEFTLPRDYAQPKTTTKAPSALEQEYNDLASRIDDIREDLGAGSQEYLTMERRLRELEARGVVDPGVGPEFYKSGHWDEPNVVAHARFDTRYDDQGRKILYVDEIQSDWHQQGRDRGYLSLGENKNDSIRLERDRLTNLRLEYMDDSGPYSNLPWSERVSKAEEISNQIRELEYNFDQRVLDAPLKSNWDEYVQKRLLRYAADNGYDGIAWSTGRQQAERWQQAITDAIDTLQYNQTGHSLRAYKNGEEVLSQTVEPQKLAEMVGADNARRLLSTEPDTFTVQPVERNPSTALSLERMPENMDPIEMMRWMDQQPEFQALRPVDGSQGAPQGFQVVDQNGNAWGYTYPSAEAAQKAIDDLATVEQRVKTVSGTNVTIGGEGMRNFYDQQFRSNMNKIGKQFGLKVDEIPISLGDDLQARGLIGDWEVEDGAYDAIFYRLDQEGTLSNQNIADEAAIFINESTVADGISDITEADVDQIAETYLRIAQNVLEESGRTVQPRDLEIFAIKQAIKDKITVPIVNQKIFSTQQGIWLNPESRTKITQQSFPLFADNTKAPVDELTAGWSEREITALDNFLKWRNSVVKQYKQIGIPINELEKYVPFIPQRPLKRDEADLLKAAFGTGVRDATADNFDTLLTELSKADPNLKARTTKATRPSQVNEMLKKPWLTEDAAVAMNIRGQRAIKAQELNSFVDEFIQTYGLRADDLAQMAGNAVPDGYTAYKLGVDQAGNKTLQQATNVPRTAIEGTDIVFLPQEMANLYNEYHGLMFNQSKKNGLLKVYDGLSTLYKKAAYLWNPGHIMRDFQGNVFNNYLMGVVDPTEYADGLKALRKADGVLSTPRGDLKYTDIYEQAQKMGIVDSVMKHELPLNVGKQEKGYSRIMRQATYATDGWTRMTGFVHNLKAGQDYAQAAATTKKFLFDYFDLTAFEKKVMRRIVPFYTWMRKNIPLQFKTLISDPRIFARLNDVQNAIAGGPIDWDEKPDYIQDMMAIQPMGSDKYFSNTLPWQDLAKIPTGLSSDSLSDLLSSVNPLIRAPIESITNTDWWTGQPLEDYAGEQTDIPVLTTLLRLLGSDTDYTVGARYGGNLLNQIPVLTRAGGLLDAATGQETSDSRILSRVSTTLGGPSVYDASSVQNSADWQERQRLVDLIRRLQDEGVTVPTVNEVKKDSRYDRLKRILGGGGPLPQGATQPGIEQPVVPQTQAPQQNGELTPGNIPLNSRPTVQNADGTISTVRSITIEEDGKYILIPTVIMKNGKYQVVSDKEAIDYYHSTGQHLGIFSSEQAADVYANQLHEQQAAQYGGGR